ncbi:MAG: hypothetical protein PHN64_05425 [Desulfovibrionaceae bacterium]|jgi:hypothetical protein|nr:hypothetical protein [Desulfovibrionaceae bacterium]
MGSIRPFDSDLSFAEHIKQLQPDELLDIWVETQQLAEQVQAQHEEDLSLDPEYESIIVRELQLRSVHA